MMSAEQQWIIVTGYRCCQCTVLPCSTLHYPVLHCLLIHTIPCSVIPCCVIPCGVIPCCVIPCCVITCCVIPCCVIPCCVIPCYVIPCMVWTPFRLCSRFHDQPCSHSAMSQLTIPWDTVIHFSHVLYCTACLFEVMFICSERVQVFWHGLSNPHYCQIATFQL